MSGWRYLPWLAVMLLTLGVVSCGRTATPTGEVSPALAATTLVRSHSGGGVEVEIEPLTPLTRGAKEIQFRLVMDTHTVDLDSYDLKALAALRPGLGQEISPTAWDALAGGHHVSGTLTFSGPAVIVPFEATSVELVLRNVADVAERVFRWDLPPGG